MDSKTLSSSTTLDEYQRLAYRSAKDMGSRNWNLVHFAMGLASDAGEAVDVVKAHTIYGKELDRAHLAEELGDTLWFLSQLALEVGYNLSDIAGANLAKLRQRYPEKYSDALAISRMDKKGGDSA